MELILASASPRRSQLLKQAGIYCSVQPSMVEEVRQFGLSPREWAQYAARMKADAVALDHQQSIVIGADTIVVLNGEVFGKPTNLVEAKLMLTKLAGKSHQVITGLALVVAGQLYQDYEITEVTFRALTTAEIDHYLAGDDWVDKAGGYGIQSAGAVLVERVVGCYTNVVGLPLAALLRLFKRAGVTYAN